MNARMGRSPAYVSSSSPVFLLKRGAFLTQSGQHIDTTRAAHACPLMLPCVRVSASLTYSEKCERTESRFSILVRACVWKRVKPGVSHAWRDTKEQGILCRKGLLSHTHTCLPPSFFLPLCPHNTPSPSREKNFNEEHEDENTWWSLLIVPVNKWVETTVQLNLPLFFSTVC